MVVCMTKCKKYSVLQMLLIIFMFFSSMLVCHSRVDLCIIMDVWILNDSVSKKEEIIKKCVILSAIPPKSS